MVGAVDIVLLHGLYNNSIPINKVDEIILIKFNIYLKSIRIILEKLIIYNTCSTFHPFLLRNKHFIFEITH